MRVHSSWVYICIYIHTYIHIYTHTHTYIHIAHLSNALPFILGRIYAGGGMKTTQVSKETTIGAKETYNVRTFDLTYAGGVMSHRVQDHDRFRLRSLQILCMGVTF